MENIKAILNNIEIARKIKILFACETGSRAWGFPSPDSDYDVRFIYMHERDWYLSLSKQKDTVEFMDGTLDATGWDLKKSLGLLKKSNAPLIERFMSPIEYYEVQAFKAAFKKLVESYYSPVVVFYHHYSLAKKIWLELETSDAVKLKSYFYLTRSLLSCNWIIKEKSVLPMHMEGLMTQVDEEYRNWLRHLVNLKATKGERYLHPKDRILTSYAERLWSFIEQAKDNLGVNKLDTSLLNAFFLKTINEHAYNRTN